MVKFGDRQPISQHFGRWTGRMMGRNGCPSLFVRWLKFNAVGAIGIVVQTAALWVLKSMLRVEILTATAIAVETAVLHNFVWHENWTWRDRTTSHRGALRRLVRFNLSNGLISIGVNIVFMRTLAGYFHWPYMVANFVGIAAGSLANYLASDKLVFESAPPSINQ